MRYIEFAKREIEQNAKAKISNLSTGGPNMYNCPNCGAPITRAKCEYCGTVFNFEAVKRASDGNYIKLDNFIPTGLRSMPKD